jgi:hypothetical protein
VHWHSPKAGVLGQVVQVKRCCSEQLSNNNVYVVYKVCRSCSWYISLFTAAFSLPEQWFAEELQLAVIIHSLLA